MTIWHIIKEKYDIMTVYSEYNSVMSSHNFELGL